MPIYYVNRDQTHNPGLHHEVHTSDHAAQLGIVNKIFLGTYPSCSGAVSKAKELYYDADGCAICCLACHRG
jgi:hypothetical protein